MAEQPHLQKVAILTSGGDAPGMNAAIRAATMILYSHQIPTVGIKYGYRGLLKEQFVELGPHNTSDILREGGTILGSARCPEFHEREARDKARQILAREGIDGLIVIGGNGSLTGANFLAHPDELGDQKLITVGIPASIDNDIGLTGQAIGVDTAMNTIVEACDKISDTASAFDRTFLIEVMGRDSGYLAMTSAVASGADSVLFPESNKNDEDALVASVVKTAKRALARDARSKHTLIIKAEGTVLSTEELKRRVDAQLLQDAHDDNHHVIETRVTVLGHVVRGGRPSAFDRLLASRFGHAAVHTLLHGHSRYMIAWLLPLMPTQANALRCDVDPYCWLVPFDSVIAETGRLRDGTSPLIQWRQQIFDSLEDVLGT